MGMSTKFNEKVDPSSLKWFPSMPIRLGLRRMTTWKCHFNIADLYSALVLWHLGEIRLDDASITSSTESRKSIGRDVGSPLPWEQNLGVAKQNTIHHHTDTLQPTNETVLN